MTSPLGEIQAIEAEWCSKIQPRGLIEETFCAQLAHATWHLRSLHRAEREAIAASVEAGSFNGESAVSLMKWRISAESAVETALGHLQSYREMEQRELPAVAFSGGDLKALARGLSRNAAAGISTSAMA